MTPGEFLRSWLCSGSNSLCAVHASASAEQTRASVADQSSTALALQRLVPAFAGRCLVCLFGGLWLLPLRGALGIVPCVAEARPGPPEELLWYRLLQFVTR